MACAKLGIPISLPELLNAPKRLIEYLSSFIDIKVKMSGVN